MPPLQNTRPENTFIAYSKYWPAKTSPALLRRCYMSPELLPLPRNTASDGIVRAFHARREVLVFRLHKDQMRRCRLSATSSSRMFLRRTLMELGPQAVSLFMGSLPQWPWQIWASGVSYPQ